MFVAPAPGRPTPPESPAALLARLREAYKGHTPAKKVELLDGLVDWLEELGAV